MEPNAADQAQWCVLGRSHTRARASQKSNLYRRNNTVTRPQYAALGAAWLAFLPAGKEWAVGTFLPGGHCICTMPSTVGGLYREQSPLWAAPHRVTSHPKADDSLYWPASHTDASFLFQCATWGDFLRCRCLC